MVVLSRQGAVPCASGDGVCFTGKASTTAVAVPIFEQPEVVDKCAVAVLFGLPEWSRMPTLENVF